MPLLSFHKLQSSSDRAGGKKPPAPVKQRTSSTTLGKPQNPLGSTNRSSFPEHRPPSPALEGRVEEYLRAARRSSPSANPLQTSTDRRGPWTEPLPRPPPPPKYGSNPLSPGNGTGRQRLPPGGSAPAPPKSQRPPHLPRVTFFDGVYNVWGSPCGASPPPAPPIMTESPTGPPLWNHLWLSLPIVLSQGEIFRPYIEGKRGGRPWSRSGPVVRSRA